MEEDLINSDIVPGAAEDLPTPIETVDVPQSAAPVWDPFGDETNKDTAESVFEYSAEEEQASTSIPASRRPIGTSLLALALSNPVETNDIGLMAESNLDIARELIDKQMEHNARMRVASQRTLDTLTFLNDMRNRYQERAKTSIIPEGVSELVEETYANVVARSREEDARTAVEMEAVDRIRGLMTLKDPHEAWLAREQTFGEGGTAEKVIIEEATRSLIASQRLEELQARYEDSGWVRGFFNGLVRTIPLLDSFSASGIADDAGIPNDATGFINFILRGANLQDQREAIWNLPLDEFARVLAPDGPLMQSIDSNAEWLLSDPTRALETGSFLLQEEAPAAGLENALGILDAGLLGLPAVGKPLKLITGLGARASATDLASKAVLDTIREGSEAAAEKTALKVEDVSEALTPSFFKAGDEGVSLGPDVAKKLAVARELREILPDIMATHRASSAEEIQAAFQTYEKSLMEGPFGSNIKDVNFKEINLKTGDVSDFSDQVAADGATVYRVEVVLGKQSEGGYSSPRHLTGLFEKYGVRGETFKDPASGQFFGRIEVDVPLDGFINAELKTPSAPLASLRSSARTVDKMAHAKGLLAGNAANRFNSAVEKTLRAALKPLSGKEIKRLNEILTRGIDEEKYYSPDELAQLWDHRAISEPVPTKVMEAYDTYRAINDTVYLLRNESMYAEKLNRGFSSHVFRLGGREVDYDAVRIDNPERIPNGNLWDATRERWLKIDTEEMKKMVDNEGYVLLKLDHEEILPDGRAVSNVMVKRTDLESRPLRRTVLNYSEGGSRAYDATHFIKQAHEDVDGQLISPRTFIAGSGLNEMKTWAQTMNRAIDEVAAGNKDEVLLDDIFQNRPGYPTPKEFLDMVDEGSISLKHKFEVVEDQGLPSAYYDKRDPALGRIINVEETSLDSYHRTQGRMYYGSKGTVLKDVTGKPAKTIDPWFSLNMTVSEAANTYSFSGYKRNMLERFKNTYKGYLDVDSTSEIDSLYGLVNARISNSVPKEIAQKIKQEQAGIRRLLNFETEFEKSLRQKWHAASEWILGDAGEQSARGRMRGAMYWLEKNNPVQFMRTVAFDANLGLFNPSQLFIQTSTIASAAALHGPKAVKYWPLMYPMKMYARSGYKDNVLDVMAKQNLWKGAFDSEQEFKAWAKEVRDSGFYEVSGHNLAQVREMGANRVWGAGATATAVVEKGRMFFYAAEQFNRTMAARIAWQDLKEAGVKTGTTEFREKFIALTDDYSFNMSSQSSAAFQHGLASIPTQFWAYGFRMMDAIMGKRFTPAQKVRLVAANFAMAGAAGIPGGALVKEIWENMKGEPISIDEADGWLARGLFDGLAYALTGADMEIGAKLGTADQLQNIIKDFFGKGDYGEKSFYEMLAGASGGKLLNVAPALSDLLYWNAAEVLGSGSGGIAKESWERMAKEIGTTKNALNAFLAYRYNAYWSKNGTLVSADLPDSSAVFMLLGFAPGAQSELSFMFDAGKDEAIDEAAKQVTKWRQDAFTFPDKYEENREKTKALMELFSPSERIKIREKAYEATDTSMLEVLRKRWEKDMIEAQFQDELVPAVEQEIKLIEGEQ